MERQSLTGSPANSKQARTRLSLAVALLAGCAIGAAVAGVVHAQANAPAFTIAEIDVIDPAEFQAFAKSNAAGVAAAGGHFLALHGRIVTEEGTPPKDIALIAWGTLDQATAYFSSPTFQALIPQRDRGANVRLFHVEGLPQ